MTTGVILISPEEMEARIRQAAAQRGIDIQAVEMLDISPSSDFFSADYSYDIFSSHGVDLAPITKLIIDSIEQLKPARMLLDSMTLFRYLSSDTFHLRKPILSILRFFAERNYSTLQSPEKKENHDDADLQFMCDGVLDIETAKSSGLRRIAITKFRGSDFHAGTQLSNAVKFAMSGEVDLRVARDSSDIFFRITDILSPKSLRETVHA